MMSPVGDSTWVGEIPPYEEGTQVYFKVVVQIEGVTYESALGAYIVGQGMVTTPIVTDDLTNTDGYGDGGFEPLPDEVMVLVAGGAIVGIIVVVLVMKRRGRSNSYIV